MGLRCRWFRAEHAAEEGGGISPPQILVGYGDLSERIPDLLIQALYEPGLPSRGSRFRNFVQKSPIFVHGFPEVDVLA